MEGVEVIRREKDKSGKLKAVVIAAGSVEIPFIRNKKGRVVERPYSRFSSDGRRDVPKLYYNNAFTTACAIWQKETS